MPDFEGQVRDRRRLGVNFFSVIRAAKKVTSNPAFEPSSQQDLVDAIFTELIGKDLPQARASEPGIDWDAVIAFIMKILPLILMIFGL